MNKKYVVGVAFSFVCIVGITDHLLGRLGILTDFEYSIDPRLSDTFHEKITKEIAASSAHEVQRIIHYLASYPCIKNVSCTISPDKKAYFSLQAYKPWYQINGQFFLENGQMCDKAFYELCCRSIPIIHAKPEISCKQLYTWLEMMPISVAQTYDVWIESETLVLLKEKRSGLGIKCLPEQLAQAAVIDRVYSILHRCAQDTNRIADMRFDEHVIVRTERGWDHGTCIS